MLNYCYRASKSQRQSPIWYQKFHLGFGLAGVFRGATCSFFGCIGHDEIFCIAAEASNLSKQLSSRYLDDLGSFHLFVHGGSSGASWDAALHINCLHFRIANAFR